MIDIYAMHFNQNGSIIENKTLIQSIPARNEGELYLVNPKVPTKAGSAESFDFSLQPNTKYYDCFYQFKTYFYVEYDGETIFYGRVLTIENGFWGEQRVKCEGALAFFNDTYLPGIPDSEQDSRTLNTYLHEVIDNHNSQLNDPHRSIYLGEVPGQYTSATSEDQKIENESESFGENNWRQTKSVFDDLTSHHGGMFRIRYNRIDNKLYLDWYKHYFKSEVSNQVVEVGKNLIDLSRITEVNNIFTVVVPVGKGDKENSLLYIDGTYFPVSRVCEFYTDEELRSGYHLPEDYRNAEATYGKIIKPQEFNDCSNKDNLLIECAKWVKENYQGGIEEFTSSAVDLHQIGTNGNSINKILCGNRYLIRYPIANGKVGERTLTCTAATFDLYNPENNQYTFGIPASSLKGYSINSTKSQKDAEEEPPKQTHNNNGAGKTEYQIWYDNVFSFLNNNRVWWNHLSAAERKEYSHGFGPNGNNLTSNFIHTNGKDADGDELYAIWVPTQYSRKVNIGTDIIPKYKFKWKIDANNYPHGYFKNIKRKLVKNYEYDFRQDNLLEYVFYEWNKNFGVSRPVDISDIPTSIEEISEMSKIFDDPEVSGLIMNMGDKAKEMFSVENIQNMIEQHVPWASKIMNVLEKTGIANSSTIITKAKEKLTELTGTDLEELTTSISIVTGNMNVTGTLTEIMNKEGEVINVDYKAVAIDQNGGISSDGSIKSGGDVVYTLPDGTPISSTALRRKIYDDEEKKWGAVVERYFPADSETGERVIHAYEFTQSIEEYEGGEIVVARVDGDKVYLGSNYADEVVTQAMNHMANVVGDVMYVEDPETHLKHWKIKSGAGLEVERNGATFGVYDNGNLDGGIIVTKLNDSSVTTHIIGDRIIVGDKSGSFYAGYIGDDHLHFYSDAGKTQEIAGAANKFYGDIPSDKVYIWNGIAFVETSKTLDLQTSNMKGLIGTRATIGELNAVKVRTSNLEADLVNADKIDARIGKVRVIHGHAIELGDSTSYFISPYYYKGLPGNAKLMDSIIRNIKVVSAGTNKYKIQYQTYDDTDEVWHDASGTFDRASLLKGSWSGGIFTVSEDSSGTTAPIASTSLKYLNTGSITRSNKNVTQKVQLRYFDSSLTPYTSDPYSPTGFEADVTIDATSVWNAARTAYKLKGTWSNGVFTVAEDSSGANAPISSTSIKYVNDGNVSRSDKTVSQNVILKYFDPNVPGTTEQWFSTGYTASVSIDATSVWNAARYAYKLKGTWSNGIFTVSENSAGSNAPIASSNLRYNKTGSISKSSKSVSQNVDLQYFENVPGTSTQWHNTGYSASVTLDASSVWDDGEFQGYSNGAGVVKVDGQSTINTSHPISYGSSMTITVPYINSGVKDVLTHTFSAPADRYQTGWNDGYDNASGQVKVNGVITVNTSHNISAGGSNTIVVPSNISGTRGTTTHTFTSLLPVSDDMAANGCSADEVRDQKPTDPIIKKVSGIKAYIWVKRASDNKWVKLFELPNIVHGITYDKVVRNGNKCIIYGHCANDTSGAQIQIASNVDLI